MRFLLILTTWACCISIFAQKFHDAALFNAPNGNVKYIEYNEGRVVFKENGQIDKENSTYLSFYKKYLINYDKEKYPISLITDVDETKIEYDNQRRISKRTVKGGSNYIVEYEYGDNTIIETKIVLENGHPQKSNITYNIITYDDRNNLTSRGIIGSSHTSTSVDYNRIGVGNTSYLQPEFHQTTISEGHVENDRVIGYYSDNVFESGKVDTDVTFEESLHPFCVDCYYPKYMKSRLESKKVSFRTGKFVFNYISVVNPNQTLYGRPIVNMTAKYSAKDYFSDYRFWITFDNAEQRNDFMVFLIEQLEEKGVKFKRKDLKEGIQFEFNRGVHHSLTSNNRKVSMFMDELDNTVPSVCICWDPHDFPDISKKTPDLKWKDNH